ncbi:MAG: hypothetical protein ACP5IO_01535 [Elusimicrobiales bacterium]
MKSEEKKIFSIVSFVLRVGVVIYIFAGVISYLIAPVSGAISWYISSYAVFFLIITPLIRIIVLCVGFYHISDYRYSFYSFIVFITVISGLILKR